MNDADSTTTNFNENTFIYKNIQPGIDDSIFVRFYIKYENNTRYHHSGVYFGGKNPASNTPLLQGGVLSNGSAEFHVGTEALSTTISPSNNSTYGFYNYWMGMHPSTQINQNTGQPYYWGNDFNDNTNNDVIDLTTWNCIEFMIKLNNPVTSSNGELALWVNGVKISHYGENFPDGNWNGQHFTEGSGNPFEGFQWRNDAALNLNYLWLKNFNTNNPQNHVGNIYFDHVVVAKNYIGPMSLTNTIEKIKPNNTWNFYPNPSSDIIQFSKKLNGVEIQNSIGEIVFSTKDPIDLISVQEFPNGLYFIKSQNETKKFVVHK